MNWAFAYGDRVSQPFAQGAKGQDERAFPPFTQELKKYRAFVANADATIYALAKGQPAPAPLPAEPPRFDPPAPTPEEEMSRFTLRDGFNIQPLADEKLPLIVTPPI